jgi:hypothetical protein
MQARPQQGYLLIVILHVPEAPLFLSQDENYHCSSHTRL